MRLRSAEQLITDRHEKQDREGNNFPIEIQEAELDESQLILWLNTPLEEPQVHVKVEFPAGKYVRLPLKSEGSAKLIVAIAEQLKKRLEQSSAVVRIEGEGDEAKSNTLLITNLQDFHTGVSNKKQRFLREAEQSAQGLLAVLSNLNSGSDEDALRMFLAFCDIPLLMAPRPFSRHAGRAFVPENGGMRTLGERDFAMALSLHQLVLEFCERHFRKLQRHISDRHPNGIANFLHITLAIGGILQSQVERAITGLEARDAITTDEWSEFRTICDVYFGKYRELAKLLWDQYLLENDERVCG